MNFPNLFQKGGIGQCELKNRIIMPLYPTKYARDGKPNPKMVEFYRARAGGGAALIVLDCPCLDYPRERSYKQQVPGAKRQGEMWIAPVANTMSLAEAYDILDIMTQGAIKARDIGYDGVEIQASYGDLISQLLSPLLNTRDDELGGSLENRSKFLLLLIGQVKELAGRDFPVMVKLVCDEFVVGGLKIEEAGKIAGWVEKTGADAIVANAGNKQTKYRTIPPLSKKNMAAFSLKADLVVLGINAQPENSLFYALQGQVEKVVAVGDAAAPGNLGAALRNATEAALKI